MIIGIPKEIMHDEARVSATPETVKKMVADGNVVLVENWNNTKIKKSTHAISKIIVTRSIV